MNRLVYLKRPTLFSLNSLSIHSPKFLIQKRFDSSSSSRIQKVELISPESDMTINTTVAQPQRFSAITDSPITHKFEDLLINLHDSLSLDWSTTVILAAFLFRLSICFPIRVYQEHLMSKLVNLQPKIEEALEKSLSNIRKNSMFVSPELKRKIYRQTVIIRNSFYKKENCQPQKIPISSVLQMPFWIYLSSATRNLTYGLHGNGIQIEQINNESFMWISSLAAFDPFYVLPAMYCLISLSSLVYSSMSGLMRKNIGKIFSARKYLSIVFICLITYFITNMPSSVGLFWISSNLFGFIELVILDSIFIRRLLRIPKTNIEPVNIYAHKMNTFKKLLKIGKK